MSSAAADPPASPNNNAAAAGDGPAPANEVAVSAAASAEGVIVAHNLVHHSSNDLSESIADLVHRVPSKGSGSNGNGSTSTNNGNDTSGNGNNGNAAAVPAPPANGNAPAAVPPANGRVPDERDAWGFGGAGRSSHGRNTAAMPVTKDSESYNMSHRRRGVALIFNFMNFDPRLGLKARNGTHADRDNLRLTLRTLDFEVRVYNDLTFKEMDRLLEECAGENHTDADCLLVSVLSHGEQGILYASDHAYKPDRLWTPFNAERCPSLAGKPKLFFIQACQGDQLDAGVHLKPVSTTVTDSSALSYKIPSHADFLIAYSTIPGFYSWRNTTAGSWFIQALCHVLQTEGEKRDLLSNLTRVSRKVAFDFQSNTPGDFLMHEKKQIPCITSMLTRDIFFRRKAMEA